MYSECDQIHIVKGNTKVTKVTHIPYISIVNILGNGRRQSAAGYSGHDLCVWQQIGWFVRRWAPLPFCLDVNLPFEVIPACLPALHPLF